jgi:hypothetical protein
MGSAAFLLILGLILIWVVATGKARKVADALRA